MLCIIVESAWNVTGMKDFLIIPTPINSIMLSVNFESSNTILGASGVLAFLMHNIVANVLLRGLLDYT